MKELIKFNGTPLLQVSTKISEQLVMGTEDNSTVAAADGVVAIVDDTAERKVEAKVAMKVVTVDRKAVAEAKVQRVVEDQHTHRQIHRHYRLLHMIQMNLDEQVVQKDGVSEAVRARVQKAK